MDCVSGSATSFFAAVQEVHRVLDITSGVCDQLATASALSAQASMLFKTFCKVVAAHDLSSSVTPLAWTMFVGIRGTPCAQLLCACIYMLSRRRSASVRLNRQGCARGDRCRPPCVPRVIAPALVCRFRAQVPCHPATARLPMILSCCWCGCGGSCSTSRRWHTGEVRRRRRRPSAPLPCRCPSCTATRA